MKHSRLDWILVACFATLAIWSGFKLYRPVTSNFDGGKSFAKLESLSNVVKSKSLGELGWGDALLGQSFKRKDQLYTYQNSKAVLALEDGQNLTLWPNTLIELDSASNGLGLEVKEGLVYLDVQKGETVNVQIEGKSYALSADNARVKLSTSAGKTTLESSAKLEVRSQEGATASIEKSQVMKVSSKKKLEVVTLDTRLDSPSDGQVIWSTTPIKKISFVSNRKNNTVIQIAKNASFDQYDSISNDQLELSTGTYYWRVTNLNGEVVSSSSVFEVKYFPAPWFIANEETPSSVEYFGDKIYFDLAWSHPNARNFEFELRHDDKVEVFPLQSFRRRITIDDKGKWQARVRALADIKSEWSTAWSVDAIVPAPIELLEPKGDATLALSEPGESVELKFVGSGIIEISKQSNFDDLIVSAKATNSYSWIVNDIGVFYWRVKNEGRFSPIRKLEINPGEPLEAPETKRAPSELRLKVINPSSWLAPIISSAYAQDFAAEFNWSEVEGAKAYKVEIFSDSNATKLIKSATTQNSQFVWIGAPLRTVWWRVSAIDGWKRQGLASNLIETKLIEPSGWEDTEVGLNAPRHGKEIEQSERILFEWDEAPGVEQWTWLLSKDLSFSNPKLVHKTKKNEIKLENMPEGTWYWRVRATDKLGRIIESRRRRITITVPDKEVIAKREERKVQYQSRLNLRSPFDFEIGLIAAKPSYELTRGVQKFTLSGFSASGFHLNLSREWGSWRGLMNLDWIAGKAFESLGYQDARLEFAMEKPFDFGLSFPLWLGGGLSYSRLSSYQRASNSNELSEESLSSIGVLGFVTAEPLKWDNSYLQSTVYLSAPSRLTLGLELRHVLGRWYWGAGFERSSQEDNGEASVTTMMLNLGYRWQRQK